MNGDWGYFPAPEPGLRDFEVEYAVWECHQAQGFSAYRRAKALQTPMTSLQVEKQEGSVAASGSLLKHTALTHPQVCPTAFKVAKGNEERLHPSAITTYEPENVRVSEGQQTICRLLEQPCQSIRVLLAPQISRMD